MVAFRNSSGAVTVAETDAAGLAYSPRIVTYGSQTWEVTVTYLGETLHIRITVPDRERERTGNYTFYLEFVSPASRYPTQESADPGYFVWMAAGLIGFVSVVAPVAARHSMEKRRREELRRQEKESRFRL